MSSYLPPMPTLALPATWFPEEANLWFLSLSPSHWMQCLQQHWASLLVGSLLAAHAIFVKTGAFKAYGRLTGARSSIIAYMLSPVLAAILCLGVNLLSFSFMYAIGGVLAFDFLCALVAWVDGFLPNRKEDLSTISDPSVTETVELPFLAFQHRKYIAPRTRLVGAFVFKGRALVMSGVYLLSSYLLRPVSSNAMATGVDDALVVGDEETTAPSAEAHTHTHVHKTEGDAAASGAAAYTTVAVLAAALLML